MGGMDDVKALFAVSLSRRKVQWTHLLFASLFWFTFVGSRLWWSVRCDMSPSTVTFVYWLVTGAGCWLLLLRSPLDDDDDDKLKRFLQNSFAADSFFTFTTPSLLFVSCSHDPPLLSIFFMIIFITKFGFTFTSLGSCCGLLSLGRLSINFSDVQFFTVIRALAIIFLFLSRNKIRNVPWETFCFRFLVFATVHVHTRNSNETKAEPKLSAFQIIFSHSFSHSLSLFLSHSMFLLFYIRRSFQRSKILGNSGVNHENGSSRVCLGRCFFGKVCEWKSFVGEKELMGNSRLIDTLINHHRISLVTKQL